MLKSISILLATAAVVVAAKVESQVVTYDNEFINATYMLERKFSWETLPAQKTLLEWADESAEGGPWSVMNKSVLPPTGTKHTYMSWAPYWWPNCTGVGNTTELTPEQIWVTCPYYNRDGIFNPDRTLVNDTITVNKMADAVLYNSLAWAITRLPRYEKRVVHYIDTWFLNPDTYMYPNLDYGQMQRGPTGQTGTRTGVLDLKCMTKVATGILMLRQGRSTSWTENLDMQMQNWTTVYSNWLETATIALQERASTNNHVSYYYNQLAGNKLIVNDEDAARQLVTEFFNGPFMDMIDANGEQPLEAIRTRPYHYRSYNLAPLIVNGKIGEYLGLNFWEHQTTKNGTIQKALDFAMTVNPGDEEADELYPKVAAVASIYGDEDGKYAKWLGSKASNYSTEPYFVWDQPFSNGGQWW